MIRDGERESENKIQRYTVADMAYSLIRAIFNRPSTQDFFFSFDLLGTTYTHFSTYYIYNDNNNFIANAS